MRTIAHLLQPAAPKLMTSQEMPNARQKRGKVVAVYDGRKWPVVRCGSVFVSADDTAQKVTQTVVTATSVAEKKRRANKYTVAVGTSHGHVQAFLEDADCVLAALDRCQVEEKCLMLIKRPKDSAKKMLKSHSWANLSVSDPQLYRQFNGIQLAHIRHPEPKPVHKTRRSSDEHSVTSNGSADFEHTEHRRRYVSACSQKRQSQSLRAASDAQSLQDYRQPDASSQVSDRQYVPRESGRQGLRYSTIPEDAYEINNNNNRKSDKSSLYHSCHDVSFLSQTSGISSRLDVAEQGHQLQSHQGPGHRAEGPGQISSDKMSWCGAGSTSERDAPPKRDLGDLEEGVRSLSLSNLATGLTLSLVGQRKADSMLDLSSPCSPTARKQPPPPPRSHAPRFRRNDGKVYHDNVKSPGNCVGSPRHSYPDSTRSPDACSRDDVFSPPASVTYNDLASPRHQHHKPSSNNSNHPTHQSKDTIVVGLGSRIGQHQQRNKGHIPATSSSSSSSQGQTPQSDTGPPRTKRSLPHVPLNETSERIKRFTEMMRSRMSGSSSSPGRSATTSISSQTSGTTSQTPLSRQASTTDNSSDCEVSTLLKVRLKDSGLSSPQKRVPEVSYGGRALHPLLQDVREKENGAENGKRKPPPPPPQQPYPFRHASSSSSHDTAPQLYCDQMSECGHSRFTSHSHSSTMDSGYTTNTEGDTDSTPNTINAVSPLHHHHPPSQSFPSHHPPPSETVYPVPVQRNPTLAGSRKFSSMLNVSSHGQQQQQQLQVASGPTPYPGEWGVSRKNLAPRPEGPAPVPARVTMNCVDHPALVEHQRRSWDLAHNFRSLDFMPTAERVHVGSIAQSRDDHVVKPQAVSVAGGVKRTVEGISPRKSHNQQRRCPRHLEGKRGSWPEQKTADHCPSQPAEASSLSALPGHWKYNNANDGNIINNNNNSTNSGHFHHNNNNSNSSTHAQRAQSEPSSNDVRSVPAVSLFQLSQSYEFCSVKLTLPSNTMLSRVLTLTTLQVTVPALSMDSSAAQLHSPQGRCAQLGGPGSAFRPVRAGMPSGGQTAVSLAAIGASNKLWTQLCTMGELRSGDVLVEVNGRQCLGCDVASLQQVLDCTQGEVMLELARSKGEHRTEDNHVQQLESNLQKLELEVKRLSEELSKKDARILELSTMLPWKREEAIRDEKLTLHSQEGAFVIGANEFVV